MTSPRRAAASSALTSLTARTSTALVALVTLTCALVGLAVAPASADASDGADSPVATTITGTVTRHEGAGSREVDVWRQPAGSFTWVEDGTLGATADSDGTYRVRVPADEPVLLSVTWAGDHTYFYGDAFSIDTAIPVVGAAGETVSGTDIDAPGAAYVHGRVVDGTGAPVAASVTGIVNDNGGLRAVGAAVATSADGSYTVLVPSDHETTVLAQLSDGRSSWLGGGSMSEPSYYLHLAAGQTAHAEDVNVGGGSLRATSRPVVRGLVRVGHLLRSSTGAWNLRPASLRYQWLRDGSAIRGATSASYRLKGHDAAHRIGVRVTARRSGCTAGSALSRTVTLARRH